jgi:fibronectin type 3 domain-containing protein
MKSYRNLIIPSLTVFGLICALCFVNSHAVAAACQESTKTYGSVIATINAPEQATYRLWSRMKASSTTNNSYMLKVDSVNCYTVGGPGVSTTAWTWVDYQNNTAAGTAASKIDLALSKGTHSVVFVGTQPDVALDQFVITSDLNCTPTGNGDNCNVAADTTPPVVTMTAPSDGATVSGLVQIAATATDSGGIAQVQYYLNSTLLATQTVGPFSYGWDSSAASNGQQSLTVKAYDTSGNFASDSATVVVQNGDTVKPSAPQNLKAVVNAQGRVTLTWTASTDNIGVSHYTVSRGGTLLTAFVPGTTYEDTTVAPGITYAYQVTAVDAAGNTSNPSSAATITVPGVGDTTPPSVPAGLHASAVNSPQVNVSWNASTDNISVVSYDVFRGKSADNLQKVATVTSTMYGDTNLIANTGYVYAVSARDAAGNVSERSATVQVTTPTATAQGVIKGTVKDGNGRPIAGATVVVEGNGGRSTYQTDSKGKYTIRGLSKGRYNITYRAPHFQPKSLTLRVDNASVTTKNIVLRKR